MKFDRWDLNPRPQPAFFKAVLFITSYLKVVRMIS
jgi:hypothetical protein